MIKIYFLLIAPTIYATICLWWDAEKCNEEFTQENADEHP